MRYFIRTSVRQFTLPCLAIALSVAAAFAQAKKPNIVFIMGDDIGSQQHQYDQAEQYRICTIHIHDLPQMMHCAVRSDSYSREKKPSTGVISRAERRVASLCVVSLQPQWKDEPI